MGDIADLHLSAATWIDRRVDRFEFVGLTTIHHAITLTLDLAKLGGGGEPIALPIGMFNRERAPTSVADAQGTVVRDLPIRRANALFREALRARLEAVGETWRIDDALREIERHRVERCALLHSSTPAYNGYADLAAEKWGCPMVGALLDRLGPAAARSLERRAIARLLFDWQNCDPLVVEVQADDARFGTLTVAFDEELTPWTPPWDRRYNVLKPYDRTNDAPLHDPWLAARVSRGGPFDADLQALARRSMHGRLARASRPRLRILGRRGLLPLTWHVVWEQWAVAGVERHIEIVVPPELAVIRLRSLRPTVDPSEPAAEVAHQVGQSAHLTLTPDRREAPELMSLLLGHRDRQSWNAGALVALLTGLLLIAAVWCALDRIEAQLEASITVLLLGPAFTAGLLSARATSEIADELLTRLRWLLAGVAVCTVLAAATLVATEHELTQVLVTAFGLLLVGCGVLLWFGAWRAWRLRNESRARERATAVDPFPRRLMAAATRHRTPVPDRFIVSGEGERVPWGWLANAPGGDARRYSLSLDTRDEDRRYWRAVLRKRPTPDAVEPLIQRGRDLTRAGPR